MLTPQNRRAVEVMQHDLCMSADEIYDDFWEEGVYVDYADIKNATGEKKTKHGGVRPRVITCGDMTMTVPQWEQATGIDRQTLYYRLRKGWSVRDALMIPPDFHNKVVRQ